MQPNPAHEVPEASSDKSSDRINDPDDFLDLYGDYLYSYAMSRVRNSSLAEDLVQDTLLKAIAKIDSFRGDAAIKTWLVTILRNEISSHFRRSQVAEKHRTSVGESAGIGQLLHPDISNDQFRTVIEREEFWTMIQNCYDKIPPHLLDVFLAKMQSESTSTADLCKEIGISTNNFAVRMYRTRLMLRKCIESTWMNKDQSE